MANEKGQVDIGFKADISNLTQQLGNVSGITDKEAKQMVTSLERAFRKAEKAAAKAAKNNKTSWLELYAVVGLAGQAYNNVVKPITEYIGKQAEAIDQIGDLSAKTQISGENIQALQMAFEQTGMTFEQVDSLLTTFSTNLGKAATIGGKAEKGFKLLNIETRDTHGVIRDTNEVFTEAISKIGELSTAQEQGAAAAQLMGSEGKNLLTAFGDVSNFSTYLELANKFGIDIGPEAIAQAAKWETANYALELSFKHAGNALFKAFGTDATNAVKVLGGTVVYITTFIGTAIDEFIQNMKNSLGDIANLFASIADGTVTWEDLGDAIDAIPDITMGGNFIKTLHAADSAASQAAEDFFVLGFEIDNMGKKAKQADQNLGKLTKPDDSLRKFYEEANKSLEQYIDKKHEEQDVLTDLDVQISEAHLKELGAEGEIRIALDQKIRKLKETADEYWYMPEVAEKTAELEALAHKEAANDWLAYQKKTLEESANDLKGSFNDVLGAMDQFEQKAHEVFNKEVVDPIMKPIEAVQGGISGIAGMIGGPFWGPLASGLADAFLNSRETIDQLKEQLMSIPDILTELPELATGLVTDLLKDVVPAIVMALPEFITGLLKAVPEIIYGLIDAIPLIIDALIDAIPDIIYAIIDSIPDIIIALLELIPQVAIALVKGIVDFFIEAIPEMAKAFWEGLKDFFIPDELFKGKEKKKSSPFGDLVKEIVSLGSADTATYNDTPGVVRAGPAGMSARLGAGDYMAAARNPSELLRQAMEAQPQREQIVSGGGYVQWADGAFAYDSFTKRHIRKKGAIYRQLYGKAA